MKLYYSVLESPGLKRRDQGERIDYRNLKSLRGGA
jgi:hypothetical protein